MDSCGQSDCRGPLLPGNGGRLRRRHSRSNSGCSKRPGTTFAPGRGDLRPAYEQFCDEQAHWLEDYALFRALKAKHHRRLLPRMAGRVGPARARLPWPGPPGPGRPDRSGPLCTVPVVPPGGTPEGSMPSAKGVRLIGDLPFFVSPDSSDVWANPELFLLDEQHRPRFVAGVPPDYFSSQGQLWGNPVYDWEARRRSGYRWCIDRLRALLAHVDAIRLDHFRGFAAAWHVPAGARNGPVGPMGAGSRALSSSPRCRESSAVYLSSPRTWG